MELWLKTVVTFLAFTAVAYGSQMLTKCDHPLEPIGCFKDVSKDRAMLNLTLNERQKIDWNNWKNYLPEFICRCAKVAYEKGYSVIGIQFYGECWAGDEAHLNYDKYGPSDTCVNTRYKKNEKKNSKCEPYSGTDLSNYVYRIAPTACKTYYEPLGCYKDDLSARTIPNYILTERDYDVSPQYQGNLIQWDKWQTYNPAMICRCATAALKKGHDIFAIQFWGECWSGTKSESKYAKLGESNECRDNFFKPCPCNSYHCVGKAKTNYVYKLVSGPKKN